MNISMIAPMNCKVNLKSKLDFFNFSEKMYLSGINFISNDKVFLAPLNINKYFFQKNVIKFASDEISFYLKTSKKINKEIKKQIKMNKSYKQGDILFDLTDLKVSEFKFKILFKEKKLDNFINGEFHQKQIINIKNEETKNESLKINFESKYLVIGKQINQLVGEKENYEKMYNCITRIRFKIKDKNKVNIEELKKLSGVKGAVWAGDELQVIVGGESANIRNEIKKVNTGYYKDKQDSFIIENSKKFSILAALSGILVPCLPILTASGLLLSIQSILVQFGALPKDTNENLWGFLLFTSAITGLSLVGIFFCYNTVKFFGGNPIYGILVGLILTSRLYQITGIEIPLDNREAIKQIHFGQFINDKTTGINGWFLFRIGLYPVTIRAYEGSIIPFLAAGILICKLDKISKRIVPKSLDLIFCPFITISLTLIPMFFIFGPLLSLFEFGLSQTILAMEGLPFGIGLIIYSMLYQGIVLTGTHNIINMTVNISFLAGTPSLIFAISTIAMFAQAGACIGVIVITKNKTFKRNATATLAPVFLGGISEPLLYGVTLPKFRPFIAGSIAAGIGAAFAYAFDLSINVPAGGGLFGILGYIGIQKQALIIVAWALTISCAAIFAALSYGEKINVKYKLKITMKKLAMIANNEDFEKINFGDEIIELNLLKDKLINNNEAYKKYEKYVIEVRRIDSKIESITEKEEKNKEVLFKKTNRLINSSKYSLEEKQTFIETFSKYDLSKEIISWENKKEKLKDENNQLILDIKEMNKSYMKEVNNLFKKLEDKTELDLSKFANSFANSVNSVDIGYGLNEKLSDKIKIKDIMNNIWE